MVDIVLRTTKGSALTYEEMDNNFLLLSTAINDLANGDVIEILAGNYLVVDDFNGYVANTANTITDIYTTIDVLDSSITANLDLLYVDIASIQSDIVDISNTVNVTFDEVRADINAISISLASSVSDIELTINAVSTSLNSDIDDIRDTVNTAQQAIATLEQVLEGDLSIIEGVVNSEITALESTIVDLQSTLSTEYYTIAQTDAEINTAISALQTELQSNIDGVSSNLSSNYYTIAQTDGEINTAISAIQTTLQSNIDGLSSTLTNDYYTIVETDAEINTAVSALETTLQSNIDTVSSNLSTNYYTSTETDGEISSAISAAEVTLNSTIEQSSQTPGVFAYPNLTAVNSTDWGRWNTGGTLTISDNQVYPTGKSWRFVLSGAEYSGIVARSEWTGWIGPKNADAYVVEIVYTLHSGSISGAGVRLDWDDITNLDDVRDELAISQMRISGRSGEVQTATAILQKPETTETFGSHDFFVFGNLSATSYGGAAAKDLEIHRIYLRTATDEELGLGVVGTTFQATLDQGYYTAVETDGIVNSAVSAIETTIQSNIDTLSSNLSTNYYTIVETDGVVNSAVSAAQTTLQSNIDDVSSNLSTNYYTSTETDSEISSAVSSAQTTLQSSIDTLSTILSLAYYTSTQTDSEISSAVSAAQTTLQSNIDTISSNLSTNYYTATETDSEISSAVSAAQTTLQSNIDTVSADLSTNYYTATETDGEISSAVSAAQTTLQSNIDTVSSNLSTNYYTAVDTDSEISSAVSALQTTLTSSITEVQETQSGYQVVYDDVSVGTAGAAVTVSSGGASLGQSDTVIVTENSTTRNTTGTTNGYYITIPTAFALQYASRRVKMSVLAKQPSTNPASTFSVTYSTADTGNSGALQSGTLTTGWQWFTFYWIVTSPNNGSTDFFGIFGDDSKSGLGTQISRVVIEVAAEADDIPEISTLSTTITETAQTVDGISGLYSLTIDNNGLISGFALTSDVLDDNTGAYSAFTIAADQFSVVDPANNAISPFTIITSGPEAGVYINSAKLVLGGITTPLIADNAVTNAIADDTTYASGTQNYNITCDGNTTVIIWVNGNVNSPHDQEGLQSASYTIKWNGTIIKAITSAEQGYIQINEIITVTAISGVNTLTIEHATSLGGTNSTQTNSVALLEVKK